MTKKEEYELIELGFTEEEIKEILEKANEKIKTSKALPKW